MTCRRIHVLSDGFRAPNARALLYPLIVHRHTLDERGYTVRIFNEPSGNFGECDLLIVDSKYFYGPERSQLCFVLKSLESFNSITNNVAWYDTTDSAGWLLGDVLPVVKRYFKNQLLRDKSRYLKPMYGRRVYADYYYQTKGVEDDRPMASPQVKEEKLLGRLRLGWNSGLADYTRLGPLRMTAYQTCKFPQLLSRSRNFTRSCVNRPIKLSCRMGVNYEHNSISHQRRTLHSLLHNRLSTNILRRGPYFRELRNSQAIISPFGLGEITLKDFEVFLTGGLLIKPDMDHMETWPDLYLPGETMMAFHWDFSNLDEILDCATTSTSKLVAAEGQNNYLRYVSGDSASELFAQRFSELADEALHNQPVSEFLNAQKQH